MFKVTRSAKKRGSQKLELSQPVPPHQSCPFKNEDSQGGVMSKVLSSVLQSTLTQWVKTACNARDTEGAGPMP